MSHRVNVPLLSKWITGAFGQQPENPIEKPGDSTHLVLPSCGGVTLVSFQLGDPLNCPSLRQSQDQAYLALPMGVKW